MRRAKVPSTSPTPADKPARTTPPVTVVRGRKGSAILPSLSATAAGRSDSANSGGAAGGGGVFASVWVWVCDGSVDLL